jgi:hypothetical protein
MLARCLPPTAFAPILPLALAHIARTPTARLAIGYRLTRQVASPGCRPPAPELARLESSDKLEHVCLVGQRQRPLGEALWIDAIVAGGQIGEAAPLANFRCHQRQAAPPGSLLEAWA